jgi:hypothetical protein
MFYNFNDGEQMVIETDLSYNSGSFIVKKYAIDDVLTARTNWEQWTDAIYKIEIPLIVKQSLIFTSRLFNEAHEK